MSDNKQFERFKQLLSGGATSDECLFYECCDDTLDIGATNLQTFKMPLNVENIIKLSLSYVQNNKVILKKSLDDFSVFNKSLLYFTITEEESLKFEGGKVAAQLKLLLKDGSILISSILKINAIEPLDRSFFNYNSESINALQANVNNQDIDVVQFIDVVANVNNMYNCAFIFDSSWDNFTKKAVFVDEYNHEVTVDIVDNKCKLPNEVLSGPGDVHFGVTGINGNLKRSTTLSNAIRVLKSCFTKEDSTNIVSNKVAKTKSTKVSKKKVEKQVEDIPSTKIITVNLTSVSGDVDSLNFDFNTGDLIDA